MTRERVFQATSSQRIGSFLTLGVAAIIVSALGVPVALVSRIVTGEILGASAVASELCAWIAGIGTAGTILGAFFRYWNVQYRTRVRFGADGLRFERGNTIESWDYGRIDRILVRPRPRGEGPPIVEFGTEDGKRRRFKVLGTQVLWLKAIRDHLVPWIERRILESLEGDGVVRFDEPYGNRAKYMVGAILLGLFGLAVTGGMILAWIGDGARAIRGAWVGIASLAGAAGLWKKGRAAGAGLEITPAGIDFGVGGWFSWQEGLHLRVGEHGSVVTSEDGRTGRIGLGTSCYHALIPVLRRLIQHRGPEGLPGNPPESESGQGG